MAEWGRIVPLIILLILVAVGAVIGLVVYGIVMEVTTKTKEKMKDNNVTMTRKGVTVALKELKDEDYKDISQRYDHKYSPSRLILTVHAASSSTFGTTAIRLVLESGSGTELAGAATVRLPLRPRLLPGMDLGIRGTIRSVASSIRSCSIGPR